MISLVLLNQIQRRNVSNSPTSGALLSGKIFLVPKTAYKKTLSFFYVLMQICLVYSYVTCLLFFICTRKQGFETMFIRAMDLFTYITTHM